MTTLAVPAHIGSRLASRCAADGEFRVMARYWTGALSIRLGDQPVHLALDDGVIRATESAPHHAITIAGPADVWKKVLAPVPPPFYNDIMPARAFGLRVEGDDETFWQYYPAIRRLIDLLRAEVNGGSAV